MEHRARLGWALVLLLSQGCLVHERDEPDGGGAAPWVGDADVAVSAGAAAGLVLDERWVLSDGAVGFADLDADGLDDIVIGGTWFHDEHGGGLVVLYGRAARLSGVLSLGRPDLVLLDDVPSVADLQMATGDFDGDGIDDVAITGYAAEPASTFRACTVRILYGDRTRRTGTMPMTTAAATLVPEDEPSACYVARAGDLDGDGTDDLAVTTVRGADLRQLVVVHGRATRWSDASALVADQRVVADVIGVRSAATGAGDVDGDGHDDLLVTVVGQPARAADVHLVYGPFGADIAVPAGPAIASIDAIGGMIGDFDANGDGLADFAVPRMDDSFLVFFGDRGRGTGDASSAAAMLSPPCAMPTFRPSIASGDVDGDGLGDLLFGSPGCGEGGRVDLVFGAPTTGSLAASARTWIGATVDVGGGVSWPDALGLTVALDGDFDGDGHADALFTSQAGLERTRTVQLAYGRAR